MANTSVRTDIFAVNETAPYTAMTPGNAVAGGGGAREFKTGEWRTSTPVIDWDKCSQCLMCAPMCPDSSIPVEDGKRLDFDLDHCKGCGICVGACNFGAISMKEGL
ncbi:MAG: 4Fe-4S binding protein [Eubacterium sp.]|nr:4Fe-4S binding protein [Eubacterium sp.]